MPLLSASRDHTSRDFDALRERLIGLIKSAFPEWTDFDAVDFGTILLECFAFVGDVLGFYIDAQGREMRLSTATEWQNVVALARMLGYRARARTPARTDIELSLPEPPRADVRVPAGAFIRTTEGQAPVRFRTLADTRIAAGASPAAVRVAAEHSLTHTQLFDVVPTRGLELQFAHAPYLDKSAEVSTAAGAFTEVDSLMGSGPTDLHYTVAVDSRERALIRFGHGQRGAIPTGTVRVEYRTGGGRSGNLPPHALRVLDGTFADARGTIVQLSATNPRPASGGDERETIERIRERAPLILRATSRAVSREDFELHAREVAGVARALMLTSNEDPAVTENAGVLYVVPDGAGIPTPALKNAVRRQLTEVYPHTLTFELNVQDPVYREINVLARVAFRAGVDRLVVVAAMKSRLQAAFAITRPDGTTNPTVDFGYYAGRSVRQPVSVDARDATFDGVLAWSDVFDMVRDTEGVRKVASWDLLLNGVAEDVRLRPEEFPVLGAIAVTDALTGELL